MMDDITYSVREDEGGLVIFRNEPDGKVWSFVEAPGNRHYQAYLAWLAEGNQPTILEP